MNPILCVGETLEEHEKNKTMPVITGQLTKGLALVSKEEAANLTIAYEPVWAIGTGHNASPEQAEESYEESIHPNFGVPPQGEVDRKGIQSILEIREVMGEMEAPLPSPEKYVDESYLRKAIASLGG